MSNVADSPLAGVVDHLLCLDSGPDSPVYTTGYTATLQALGMLGESCVRSQHRLVGTAGSWPPRCWRRLSRSWPTCSDAFEAARIIDVVASGASSSSCGEGAPCCASRPGC